MDATTNQWNFREGTEVFGADGDKVGKVIAVHANYIVVEKGFFFPTDYYIPTSAIANVEGDQAFLNVSKDDALNSGWNEQPTGDYADLRGDVNAYGEQTASGFNRPTEAGGTYLGTEAVDDTMAAGGRPSAVTQPAGAGGTYLGTEPADTTGMGAAAAADASTGMGIDDTYDTSRGTTERYAEGDTLRVPVHEEELTATKRPVEMGEVRIDKGVVEEERQLDVPVTEERVRVTRRTVDRDATGADDTAFAGGTIEVPVRGEEVELQKRVRVAEEVEVGKEQVQRTERVGGTVRREEVRVDDATADVERRTDFVGDEGSTGNP